MYDRATLLLCIVSMSSVLSTPKTPPFKSCTQPFTFPIYLLLGLAHLHFIADGQGVGVALPREKAVDQAAVGGHNFPLRYFFFFQLYEE